MINSTPSAPLIEVTNLSFAYPGQKMSGDGAIVDMNFAIAKGQVVGLLGPNGAGKSTTMRLLTGTLKPQAGQILIAGFDIVTQAIEAKRQMGYLADVPPLYPEFTVDEYLGFCAQIQQITKPKIKAAVDLVKQRCGLSDKSNHIISHLSKGYQQRLGIAQAIIHEPPLIILDEPSVGLDPIQNQEIKRLIQSLGEQHSILISSHILSDIEDICGTIQIINHGNIIFNDAIQGLQQQIQRKSLLCRFENPIDASHLSKLEGVSLVMEHSSRHWEIEYQQDAMALSKAIIALANTRGWGIYEIYPQNSSLEQVFMQLTEKDNQQRQEQYPQAFSTEASQEVGG